MTERLVSSYHWLKPVPTSQLEREQGIAGPQGLVTADMTGVLSDDEVERYLAVIFDDPPTGG